MLRTLFFAAIAWACLALGGDVQIPCIATFGANHGGLQACSVVSGAVLEELARNCTEGDVSSAHAALSAYCDEARQGHDLTLQTTMNSQAATTSIPSAEHVSRMVMRRAPAARQIAPSPDTSRTKRSAEGQDRARQSPACTSYKYQVATRQPTVSNGFSLGTLFAERSVRFAISGLLVTTLTSFLFL